MKNVLINIINYYIQAFIYSFEIAYDSSHEIIDDTIIFHYGQKFSRSPYEMVPYQSIVFANNKTPEEIDQIVKSYSFKGDGSFAIQVFHKEMNPQKYKMRYQPLGYDYFLPNILQQSNLSKNFDQTDIPIHQVTEAGQVGPINNTFSDFKPFPEKLIHKKCIIALYAEIDHQAAGWGYMVRKSHHSAYVAGMFTHPDFRQKGVSTAILHDMHQRAKEIGIHKIYLVPSFMAWNFYTKRGYETVAHFSTFLPS
jgi:hypothetical protein